MIRRLALLSAVLAVTGCHDWDGALTRCVDGGLCIDPSIPAVAISTTSLPDGAVGVAYSQALAATGGVAPYTWSIASGALPSGISLSGDTLAGTPSSAGAAIFTVRVTDSRGLTKDQPLSLTIAGALAVSTSTLADGYTADTYTGTVIASGGRAPYSFAISGGALPAGVSLSSTGALSGTPTAVGSSDFTVEVTDANAQTATRALQVTIYAPPAFLTSSLDDGYTAEAYSKTVAVEGGKGTLTVAVSSGALPAGMSVSSAGVLGGIPTATGLASFTLTVSDLNGKAAARAFGITVYDPPSFTTSGALPSGYKGDPYSAGFSATGGKGTLTFSQASGTLPGGLALSGNQLTGTLTGVNQDQLFTFGIQATDANNHSATLPCSLRTFLAPQLTTTTLPQATEGVRYATASGAVTIVAANGIAPLSYAATGLPSGLAIDSATGTISGIPGQGTTGTVNVDFTVSDGGGKVAAPVTIPLQVLAPTPLVGGGVVGKAPSGSTITDALTVFVVDNRGRPRSGVGVRIRRNGVEYSPAKDGITDVGGKAFFSGLGLNGTTDTVDITANGIGITNYTLAKVNAAVVTIAPSEYPVPLPRHSAGVAYDSQALRILLAGGGDTGKLLYATCTNDLLTFNRSTNTWAEALPAGMDGAPSPREAPAFAYASSGVSVLFGGYACLEGQDVGDTWEYVTATNTWSRIQPAVSPTARFGAATTSDPAGAVYMFGGDSYINGANNELWKYDANTNSWTQLASPMTASPRRYASLAYHAAAGELWMCGGEVGSTLVSDCWIYRPVTGDWIAGPTLPGPHSGAAMTYYASNGRMYLFGGLVTALKTTSELLTTPDAVTAWSTVSAPVGPEARVDSGLVSIPNQGLFLVAGHSDRSTTPVEYGDVWNYLPATGWSRRAGPATGYTLSGTISGMYGGGGNNRVTIYVSSDSGFATSTVISFPPGVTTGTYTIPDLPAGATVAVHAIDKALNSTAPQGMYSFLDLGTIGPITGNVTRALAFPGQLPTTQASATMVLPSTWTPGAAVSNAAPQMRRPGFELFTNGIGSTDLITGAVALDYWPVAGAAQGGYVNGLNQQPSVCSYNYRYLPSYTSGNLGTLTLPPTPTAQSFGRGCSPVGPLGLLVEEQQYTFSASDGEAQAVALAVGDVSGDGLSDLAIVNGLTGAVGIHRSTAIGFQKIRDLTPPQPAKAVAIADVVGDANLDVIVATDVVTAGIAIFPGQGGGNFGSAIIYPASVSSPTEIVVADVTGDTVKDLVVLNSGGAAVGSLTLLRGTGGGFTAQAAVNLNAGGPYSISTGQLAGAGALELAVTEAGANQVEEFDYDSVNVALASLRKFPAGAGPRGVTVGNVLPGTAGEELVVANEAGQTVTVYSVTGALLQTVPLPSMPVRVQLVDIDTDGTLEVWCVSWDRVYTLRSVGGTVSISDTTALTSGPIPAAVGEINGDGIPDLVLAEDTYLDKLLGRKPAPNAVDATYSFNAPADARLFLTNRAAQLGAIEWEYTALISAGPVSFDFPLASTNAPSRPWPSNRTVNWDQNIYSFTAPATFDPLQFRLGAIGHNGFVGTDYFIYHR